MIVLQIGGAFYTLMGQYNDHSDAELLILLKNGDEYSFTEIYRRYWKPLIDAAYRRLKDKDEAQEIVQELFVNIYVRKDNLDPGLSLNGLLHTALKYRVLNYFRHKVTKERYTNIIAGQANYALPEAELYMDSKELTDRLRCAVDQLPERCKEVFVLSKIERLSHAEIAGKLGISVSTVEKHIAKGMGLMRKHLGSYDANLIVLAVTITMFNS